MMCGYRSLILFLIVFSVLRENQGNNLNASDGDNQNHDDKIKNIDLKLEIIETKLEKLENNQFIENIEENLKEMITKTIEVKFQSFISDFSKFLSESEKSLNNRQKAFEDKIVEISTESLKSFDLKLDSTANDIMETIKAKSESCDNSTKQKNDVSEKQIDNIQNSINRPEPRENCAEVLEYNELPDGIYQLRAPGDKLLDVYCMRDRVKKHPPAWTVIQRRQNGEVDFYRNWTEYKNGFGNLENDFWFGLDQLHAMTSKQQYELLINLEDWEGYKRFAKFNKFAIENENAGYRLVLGDYSGNAGNSLGWHNNMKFSTMDVNNDPLPGTNCAKEYKGAWWYHNGCFSSNLNGVYNSSSHDGGISWNSWHGFEYSLKYVQMAIRPITVN